MIQKKVNEQSRLIKKKRKGDYFRLEQTKEGLRFNDAKREEREKEKTGKHCMEELSILRPSSRRLIDSS